MKKTFLLFFILFPFIAYSQTEKTGEYRKFGIGMGYRFNSVMGDSLRPVEISLRYRINDRHTLQLYAPVSYKKTSIRHADDIWKQTLWGVGLGYDYIYCTYSHMAFFAGIKADYQWYQNRNDEYYKGPKHLSDGSSFETEQIYYYWDKSRGLTISPNIGIRFFPIKNIATEALISIPFSKERKESYSFYSETAPGGNGSSEMFYPDKRINQFKISSNIYVNISYYF